VTSHELPGHVLTLITCDNPDEAGAIARHLVESRLAAGVQIIPIESIYRWEEEVVEDQEWLLIAKTRRERFPQILSLVDQLHSYEVAPVLMIEIDAAGRPYLDWIDANTRPLNGTEDASGGAGSRTPVR
jgi:periplasmic divalent cation tolerance protein